MKYWLYAEPAGHSSEPVWTILSDKAVLAWYFPHWSERMTQAGKADQINEQQCIEDWVSTNWAVEATPKSLLRIINE